MLSGTIFILNFDIASFTKYSELLEMNVPQLPISEIEIQTISSELLVNHSGSFRGGVFPIDISKNSSAFIVFLSEFSLSTNHDLNRA